MAEHEIDSTVSRLLRTIFACQLVRPELRYLPLGGGFSPDAWRAKGNLFYTAPRPKWRQTQLPIEESLTIKPISLTNIVDEILQNAYLSPIMYGGSEESARLQKHFYFENLPIKIIYLDEANFPKLLASHAQGYKLTSGYVPPEAEVLTKDETLRKSLGFSATDNDDLGKNILTQAQQVLWKLDCDPDNLFRLCRAEKQNTRGIDFVLKEK